MAIFLKILAILGIVLLSILGFVLLLLLVVLFWPISYSANGHKHADDIAVKVKVSWLLGLVRFMFEYPEPKRPQLKILFIDLLKKKKKKDSDEEPKEEDKTELTAEESIAAVNPEESTEAEKQPDPVESESQQPDDDTAASKEEDKVQNSLKKSFTEKIQDIFTNIHYKIMSTYDMIKKMYSNIEFYIDLLHQKFTKEMLLQIKKRLLLIVRSIRPRKLIVHAVYGSGEPDSTGKTYGYYCMALPFLGKHVTVEPDFEQKILEGDFQIKGRIYLFKLAYHGIRLYLNKNTRIFLKKLKQGKS